MTDKETTFVNYWKSIVYLNRDAMQLQQGINGDLETALKFVYLLEEEVDETVLKRAKSGWIAFISFYVESVQFGYATLQFERSLGNVSTLSFLKDRLELEKSEIERTIKFRRLIVAAWEAQSGGVGTDALTIAINQLGDDSFVNMPNGLEMYSADTVIINALEKILSGADSLTFIKLFFIRMSKWMSAVYTSRIWSGPSDRYKADSLWFSDLIGDSVPKYKELLNWLVRKCIDKDTSDFENGSILTSQPLKFMSVLRKIERVTSTGEEATLIDFNKVMELLTLIRKGHLLNSTQHVASPWPTFGTDPSQSSSPASKLSSGVAFLMAMGGAVNILTELGEEGYSDPDKVLFKAGGNEEAKRANLAMRLIEVGTDLDAATVNMGTGTITVSERYSKDDRYFKLAFRWWKYFKTQSIKPVSNNAFKPNLQVPQDPETDVISARLPRYPTTSVLWNSAGLERDPYTYTRLELLTDPPDYLPLELVDDLTLFPFNYKKYLDAKRQKTDSAVEFMRRNILNAEVKTLEGEKRRGWVINGLEEALRSNWITFAKTQTNLLESIHNELEDMVEDFIDRGTPLDVDRLESDVDPLFVEEFMKTEKHRPLYFTKMGIDLKFKV